MNARSKTRVITIMVLLLNLCLIGFHPRPAVAAQRSQITFVTAAPNDGVIYWRVVAEPNALPENVSTRLTPFAVNANGNDKGSFRTSWNGAWYVFASERFDAEAGGWAGLAVAPGTLTGVSSVRTATGVIHGSQPAISNDGKTIIYSDRGSVHQSDIFITRLNAGVWSVPVPLTTNSPYSSNSEAVFSADEQTVYFNAGNSFEELVVAKVNIDGSNLTQVITNANAPAGSDTSQVFRPAEDPTDHSIVFETAWTGGEQIWRMTNRSNTVSLVGTQFSNDNSPVVLPDGRIASLWLNHPNGNGGHHLKVMDRDGGNEFMLTLPTLAPNITDVLDYLLGAGFYSDENSDNDALKIIPIIMDMLL